MAYTRNFGFRAFENIVRDGRNQTPASGTPFLIGSSVQVDSANPGVLKAAVATTAPTPLSGVLVYEWIQYQGVDPFLTSPQDYPFTTAPLGRFAQLVHGPGVKVWFKNTADKPLYDGRIQPGQTMVTGVGGATPTVAVGDYLTPDGSGLWQKGDATNGWMQVEVVNNTSGLVEARLVF